MGRKKESCSEAQLRDYIKQHEINFEGPVLHKRWPDQHKHLFHVIQEIGTNQYDRYIQRSGVDKRALRRQKDRVKALRTQAYILRQGLAINESTWRHLTETLVIERFNKDILWSVSSSHSFLSSSLQTHFLLVAIVGMRNGNQTTKHSP